MSEQIDWIVDIEATAEEAPVLAQNVLTMLREKNIVGEARRNDFSDSCCYPTLPGASDPAFFDREKATYVMDFQWSEKEETFEPMIRSILEVSSYLTIDTEPRNVFHTGEYGTDKIICPACGKEFDPDEIPWIDAAAAWSRDDGSDDTLTCDSCGHHGPVTEWRLEPEWGFGNLGFAFHWPITENLVREIQGILGHRIKQISTLV